MDVVICLTLFIGFALGFTFCKWFTKTTIKEVYQLLRKEAEENRDDDRDFWKPEGWKPDIDDET